MSPYFGMGLTKRNQTDIVTRIISQLVSVAQTMNKVLLEPKRIEIVTVYMIVKEFDPTRSVKA